MRRQLRFLGQPTRFDYGTRSQYGYNLFRQGGDDMCGLESPDLTGVFKRGMWSLWCRGRQHDRSNVRRYSLSGYWGQDLLRLYP